MGLTITVDQLLKAYPEEFADVTQRASIQNKLAVEGMYRRELKEQMEKIKQLQEEESFKIPPKIDYNS